MAFVKVYQSTDRDLVPDPTVCAEFGISPMTLYRWTNDPALGFPPKIKIKTRNYRSRKALEAWKHKQVAA